MSKLKCLRCGSKVQFCGTHEIQLGRTGWFLGDLPNLLAGAMEVDIYVCEKCRKMEFYNRSEDAEYEDENELPQKKCPKCGKMQDFDYPKCPYCDYIFDT